mmetsp:Transcript_10403/g.35901  ORF Transcript_10403/g.35901 Transcript_10403/m.35901 type:complete len:275 (+) Transcript_10403:1894-2718(+)
MSWKLLGSEYTLLSNTTSSSSSSKSSSQQSPTLPLRAFCVSRVAALSLPDGHLRADSSKRGFTTNTPAMVSMRSMALTPSMMTFQSSKLPPSSAGWVVSCRTLVRGSSKVSLHTKAMVTAPSPLLAGGDRWVPLFTVFTSLGTMWFSHALFSEEGLETAAETLPPARSRLLEHEPAEHATLLSAPRALEDRGGSPGPAGCGGSLRAAEQLTPRLADCRLGRDLADPYLRAVGLVFCISLTQNKSKKQKQKKGWASPQQHGPEDARFRPSLSLSL